MSGDTEGKLESTWRTEADGSLPPDIFVLDDHSLLGNGSIFPHANLRDIYAVNLWRQPSRATLQVMEADFDYYQ
jgi:hypothetical protein